MLGIAVSPVFSIDAGSSMQAQTSALIARMVTPPTGTVLTAIDTFFAALNANSIALAWFNCSSTQISATTADLLLDWVNPVSGVAVNSPTFGSGGVTPNGSTSYVKTGFKPSMSGVVSTNSISVFEWITGGSSFVNVTDMGNTENSLGAHSTGSQIGVRSASSTAVSATTTVSGPTGFTLVSRTSSGSVDVYRDGSAVQTGLATASVGLSSDEFYIGARNNAGVATTFSNRVHLFDGAAAGMNSAKELIFFNALSALKTGIGA